MRCTRSKFVAMSGTSCSNFCSNVFLVFSIVTFSEPTFLQRNFCEIKWSVFSLKKLLYVLYRTLKDRKIRLIGHYLQHILACTFVRQRL